MELLTAEVVLVSFPGSLHMNFRPGNEAKVVKLINGFFQLSSKQLGNFKAIIISNLLSYISVT